MRLASLPLPGPSELARRGALDRVPEGYWPRYADEAAARIREQTARVRCTCERPGAPPGARCWRCHGQVTDAR